MDDARVDADAADASVDDAPCSTSLVLDPATVTSLPAFGTGATSPALATGGRELYYAIKTGTSQGTEIYRASRASEQATWSMGTLASGLNSDDDDTEPSITADGLHIVFTSNRATMTNVYKVYEADRTSVSDEWTNVRTIDAVTFNPHSIDISADGLALYVVDADNVNGLYVLRRSTIGATFGQPTMVGLGTMFPSVDAGQQVLYWSDDQGIRRAMQNSGTFIGAEIVLADGSQPDLSHDGRYLYFRRTSGLAYIEAVCAQ